ncbi:hypothetical protein Neosp_011981 [[Neocosmospora] mangrovei]
MSQQVRGKSAIITGAGSGLNFAFATKLLSLGCNVLLADLALRPESEELVNQHARAEAGKGRAVFQKTDVTSWKQLEAMFTTAEREFGDVSIVVAGAGVFEPDFSSFWIPPGSSKSRDAVDGDRYAQIDINITHPIRTTQLAISSWLNKPSEANSPKTVVIVSSTNGQQASFATPVYAATKHAINGFVRSLGKLEQSHHIRVVAVAPGIMRTPMYLENAEKLSSIDQQKDAWSEPSEVAEVMLALVERDAVGTNILQPEGPEDAVKIVGGSIIEATPGGAVRQVAPYNDPGPLGPGALASNIMKLEGEIKSTLVPGWG